METWYPYNDLHAHLIHTTWTIYLCTHVERGSLGRVWLVCTWSTHVVVSLCSSLNAVYIYLPAVLSQHRLAQRLHGLTPHELHSSFENFALFCLRSHPYSSPQSPEHVTRSTCDVRNRGERVSIALHHVSACRDGLVTCGVVCNKKQTCFNFICPKGVSHSVPSGGNFPPGPEPCHAICTTCMGDLGLGLLRHNAKMHWSLALLPGCGVRTLFGASL